MMSSAPMNSSVSAISSVPTRLTTLPVIAAKKCLIIE